MLRRAIKVASYCVIALRWRDANRTQLPVFRPDPLRLPRHVLAFSRLVNGVTGLAQVRSIAGVTGLATRSVLREGEQCMQRLLTAVWQARAPALPWRL